MRRSPVWIPIGICLMALGCKGDFIGPGNSGGENPPSTGTATLLVRLGDTGVDQVIDVASDPDGSVYATGTFTGSVDFDPGTGITALTSLGLEDVFLAKYSTTGALVWVDRIGGTAADNVSSLARDAAGNLYLGGTFEGASDLDPGPGIQFLTSEGGADGLVAKFSSTGNLVWARRYGGLGADAISDVAVDGAGNLYAAGSFAGQADALPLAGGVIVSEGAAPDGFLLSLDAGGAVRYACAVGGIENDEATAVTVTADGLIVLAGTFRGNADFGPGVALAPLTSAGGTDAFIASYTAAGVVRWARAISGINDEDAQRGGLTANGLGDVAVSGSFAGTTDFDPGTPIVTRTSLGGTDWYVATYDANGGFKSVFSVGGAGADIAPRIAFDAGGNLLATGQFRGPVDFDPGAGLRVLSSLATAGSDAFVARYTSSGGLTWISAFGQATAAPDRQNAGSAVVSGPAGTVLVGGRLFGSVNFGAIGSPFVLTSLADADGFLVKLTAGGVLATTP